MPGLAVGKSQPGSAPCAEVVTQLDTERRAEFVAVADVGAQGELRREVPVRGSRENDDLVTITAQIDVLATAGQLELLADTSTQAGAEAKAIIRRAAEARNLDLVVLVGKPCYEVDLVVQRPVEPQTGRQLIAAGRAVVAVIVVA